MCEGVGRGSGILESQATCPLSVRLYFCKIFLSFMITHDGFLIAFTSALILKYSESDLKHNLLIIILLQLINGFIN